MGTLTRAVHGTSRHVGQVTVRAHPEQTVRGHGTLLFGGNEWEWGPEWHMGDRAGRWAVAVDDLATYAVRVEWDASEPLTGGFEFGCRVSRAVNARPEAERADMRGELLSELSGFDAMCADLWQRHANDDR